jgi:hypothetical protein
MKYQLWTSPVNNDEEKINKIISHGLFENEIDYSRKLKISPVPLIIFAYLSDQKFK